MLDILIKNGTCPDFGENAMIRANVGLSEGKIACLGREEPEAALVIDAAGKVVSPGFIDIHMHEEKFLREGEHYCIANMMLAMGVTTAMGGNCGDLFQSVGEFRAVVERLGGAPVNYLLQSGYNTYRERLGIGWHEGATDEQIAQIQKSLLQDLADGACGVSFGIEYAPGMTTREILKVLACLEPDMYVSAHYRSDSVRAIPAIREMVHIADSIPQKFQISHLSSCSAMGQMDEALAIINEAIDRNPRLDYDTYPYNAFSTRIGTAVFEPGCLDMWKKDYGDIMLTQPPYEGVRCTREIFDDARANYPDMLAVAFAMNEEEICQAIVNRHGMVASDGILSGGKGHPRAGGTFPRVLGKYVRQEGALPMIDALRKMTLEPARRLELRHKGRLCVGFDADITVFDPETVIDGATWTDPSVQPEGIDYVIVGGKLAMDHKRVVNDRLGRFISRWER